MASSTVPAVALGAGVALHQFYFKRSEHHLQSPRYLQLFIIACLAAPVHFSQKAGGGFEFQYTSSLARWTAIALFVAGALASLLTYRAFFHPLNKFSGPFGARISDLWYSARMAKADAPLQLLEFHKQYGPFVRVGSSSLSIIHPEAVQAIHGLGTKCRKGLWYDQNEPFTSLQTTRNKADHDQRRRVWSPAFSDKAIRGYEERMKPYCTKLIEQLRAFGGKPVNASAWFNYLTYDVMGDLAFNKSFNMLERGEEHWAIKLLNGGMEPIALWLPEWLFVILLSIPGVARDFWKFITYCGELIEARMTQNPHVPDIMTALLAPYAKSGPPKGMERIYLHADSRLIVVAGSDTTAATLTHLFYRLCANPLYIPQLRAEFAPFVDEAGDAKNADLQNCDLLNGCINEALRLNPPVPSQIQRVTPPEGIEIGGRHIPGNCKVWSPQYVVSRNEEIYADAESFVPERWGARADMLKDGGRSFAPFSIGTYGCIGKPLALMEVRAVAAKVLTCFDVGFAEGEDGRKLLYETRDHFTLGLAPLRLVFRERKV